MNLRYQVENSEELKKLEEIMKDLPISLGGDVQLEVSRNGSEGVIIEPANDFGHISQFLGSSLKGDFKFEYNPKEPTETRLILQNAGRSYLIYFARKKK